MKKIYTLFVATSLLILLCGCNSDLNQYMIVKGFSIDLKDDVYSVALRYESLNEITPEEVVTVEGSTVADAVNKISLISGKEALFSSTGYIICSEKVAKKGLNQSLDFFIRYFKGRPTVKLYITNGEGADIINAKNDDKLIPSSLISDIMGNEENQGKIVTSSVMEFISDSNSENKTAVVPVINLVDKTIETNSSAYFKNYILVGLLSEEQTKGFLALSGKLEYADFVIKDEENNNITVEVQGVEKNTEIKMIDSEPVFSITLNAKIDMEAMPLQGNISNIMEINYDLLEDKCSEKLYQLSNSVFDVINLKEIDLLNFSNQLYLEHSEYWSQNKNIFLKTIPQVEVSLTINSDIIRTGEEESGIYG